MRQREGMIDFAREALGISDSNPIEMIPLEGRGSDRAFFRLKWNQDSAILVHYDPQRIENTCYAAIAGFLQEIGIPVPRLVRHDPAACLILMEDLGDKDLWSFREEGWETRRDLYHETLSFVHRLHSFPQREFPADRVKLMERFGPDLYRWERGYFLENFVKGFCGIQLKPLLGRELETELAELAGRLERSGVSLVHRDLQSQNVMIRRGEPFLIDFQGMRFGSPFYDLGSLLCDPYVDFSEDEILDLLSFYYSLSQRDLDWRAFRNFFWEATAQRLMQALGAYGFLGLVKGLEGFLAHIPAGLRNLQRAAAHLSSCPLLHELTHDCQRAFQQKSIGSSREFSPPEA